MPAIGGMALVPRAPRDEADTRIRKYFIMMSVRASCFLLMVLVTPYGWYTWLFAVGAIVLPYLAVVVANVAKSDRRADAVPPERQLTAGPSATPKPEPTVVRLTETRHPDAP